MKVLDRARLGLAPPAESITGVYVLRAPHGTGDVTVVLQESAVTYAFVSDTLPLLEQDGIDARVYYVASAELFDRLTARASPGAVPRSARVREAIGITGFTLPTLYRWVRSDAGRERVSTPPPRVTTSAAAGQKSCSRRRASTVPASTPRSRDIWTPRFAVETDMAPGQPCAPNGRHQVTSLFLACELVLSCRPRGSSAPTIRCPGAAQGDGTSRNRERDGRPAIGDEGRGRNRSVSSVLSHVRFARPFDIGRLDA